MFYSPITPTGKSLIQALDPICNASGLVLNEPMQHYHAKLAYMAQTMHDHMQKWKCNAIRSKQSLNHSIYVVITFSSHFLNHLTHEIFMQIHTMIVDMPNNIFMKTTLLESFCIMLKFLLQQHHNFSFKPFFQNRTVSDLQLHKYITFTYFIQN